MSRSWKRRLALATVTAWSVAAASWLASAFAFYIGNALDAGVLIEALDFFALATIGLALLLTVLIALGALRSRWSSALAAAGASIAASLLATATQLGKFGVTGFEAAAFLLGSLFGVSLIFCLSAIALTMFWAPKLHRSVAQWRPKPRHRSRPIAIVRHPSANLDEGELTHISRTEIDYDRALEQWDNYCATLISEGFELVELPEAPGLADAVFTEDTVLLFDSLAVLTRPGAESRRAEREAVERYLRGQRGLRIERITEPGTLDGGDVLNVGRTVYVGASSRTNGAGIQQLRALLGPLGYRVVAVPVRGVLHLKTAVTALPDGSVIGDPRFVDASLFPEFLPVPEAAGASVLALDASTVLLSAAAPQTAELLAGNGYRVLAIDVSEFEKLEGGVTCLSARWDQSLNKSEIVD